MITAMTGATGGARTFAGRVLGVDLGSVRIGLALSRPHPDGRVAALRAPPVHASTPPITGRSSSSRPSRR